jgi:hypothetical protein
MSFMSIDVQNDGPRNTCVEVNIHVNHEPIEPTCILDPMKRYRDPLTPTTRYRIDYINYVLHKDLAVDLWWEVSGEEDHKLIRHLEGRGTLDTQSRGGLNNTAGDAKTGRILLSASGWTEGVPLTGSLTIEAVKQ